LKISTLVISKVNRFLLIFICGPAVFGKSSDPSAKAEN
jgi:hypothetical protein